MSQEALASPQLVSVAPPPSLRLAYAFAQDSSLLDAKPTPWHVLHARSRGVVHESSRVPALQVASPGRCIQGSVQWVRCTRHRRLGRALCLVPWCGFVRPNVRDKRATTAGRQARAGENVLRTTGPGLVACRWCSA